MSCSWFDIDNRECWSDYWLVPCSCCLDSLHPCKVKRMKSLVLFLSTEFCQNHTFLSGAFIYCCLRYWIGNCRTNRLDIPLKVAIFFPLPALFGLWLGLSIAGSVLVGVGYGFFTPWVSAFEAFRNDNECKKLFHCVVVYFRTFEELVSLFEFYF